MELMKAREATMAWFRPMLRDHGLTEQQWRVIRALSETGGIDAGELAARSFLLAPCLTRILQHLESDSLISRKQNVSDNRKAVVALSAKGRRLFEKVAPHSESLYAVIEDKFGVDRLEELYTLLADLHETLNNDR
jgi:homoprotocatechuate degradation regulator HpaR